MELDPGRGALKILVTGSAGFIAGYLVHELLARGHEVVGVLGMAFKAESDDPRDSLSYKLRNLLALEARKVLCTDPYVADPALVPVETVLADADVLFLATPHRAYRELRIPPGKILYDVWNCVPGAAR